MYLQAQNYRYYVHRTLVRHTLEYRTRQSDTVDCTLMRMHIPIIQCPRKIENKTRFPSFGSIRIRERE